jgi:hypothetical protein
VGLLHVLLAVALTLGSICARLELALVEARSIRVLVVNMAIALLLSRPADFEILACGLAALPGA